MDANLKRKADEVTISSGKTKKVCSKLPKEWSDLSAEVKCKIFDHLDLKTRLKFRAVCRTDRRLIDSQKLKFNLDFKTFGSTYIDITVETAVGFFSASCLDSLARRNALLPLISYLLKVGCIGEMCITSLDNNSFKFIRDEFAKNAPVEVEQFLSRDIIPRHLQGILTSMKCQRIELGYGPPWRESEQKKVFNCDRLMELPAIVGAQDVFLNARCPTKIMSKVIRKWIENDAPIGTHFQVFKRETVMRYVCKEFDDRVCSRCLGPIHLINVLTIRTDNAEKVILVNDPRFELNIQCIVVPASLDLTDVDVYESTRDTCLQFTESAFSWDWDF